MIRKEAKELLPIIQAFADGKTIQERKLGTIDWVDTETPWFNPGWAELRIKPECEYRPFKSHKECWDEMHKHPDLGWIMTKNEEYLNIVYISTCGIRFVPFDIDGSHSMSEDYNFTESFNLFRFADGTPFGIKEE